MITCPWCGTSYTHFISNCKNCGGPIPLLVEEKPAEEQPQFPPPPDPPRNFSASYVWRLMLTDTWTIFSFVFGLIGIIFTFVGVALIFGIITAIVGIPFAGLGLLFLAGAGGIIYWRFQEKQKIVDVLRWGVSAPGRVTDVQINYNLRINGRHPWIIDYIFQVNGKNLAGQVTTLTPPIHYLQPGIPVYVLYMPANPEQNALYPHP